MIIKFDLFESVFYQGSPNTGDYVVFAPSTWYYQEGMIGKIKRIKTENGVDSFFVDFPDNKEQIDDSGIFTPSKVKWFKFERNDFLCWSKNKNELIAYMKGKQFDL